MGLLNKNYLIGNQNNYLKFKDLSQYKNIYRNLFVNENSIILGKDPSDIQRIIDPPKEVDLNVWLYEHLR